MGLVIEGIKASYANILTGDYGGIRDWKALNINGYDEPAPPKELKPHEKLFLAILMDAIETLKRDPLDKQNRRSWAWAATQRWLLSDDDTYVLGFVPICEHFGWDSEWVRKKIIEHIKKTRKGGKAEGKFRREQVRKNWELGPRKKRRRKVVA